MSIRVNLCKRPLEIADGWVERIHQKTADKLERALAEFQAQQLSLGKEMGIPIPAS
jgi:hypothetical protein